MFDQRRIRKRGLAAQALVLSVREASALGGNGSWQKYDFVLEVRPGDREAFRAELRERFYIVERKPGEADVVSVKYDPHTLKVIFDLAGDPRFDVEAMQRRTAQLRWDTYQRSQSRDASSEGRAAFVTPQGATPGRATEERTQALARLVGLRDAGAISEEEFTALKARLSP
ncbi:SHOCT domain-containing protein [Micromonospora carbonacea]|uniref:Short C-terminal domain-containing protein n=1 Tax=Micromonospora carbonacea TaxID=47853 RepID=A0A1C4ZDJ4_9ACTN|nr:SHOCT domain-containing protein [Micromonospora carbonacea]SCF31080.1 Short C-terminal domain-containing protein [Micromonospora carbonacea]